MDEPVTRPGAGPANESTAGTHHDDTPTMGGEIADGGPRVDATIADDCGRATHDDGRTMDVSRLRPGTDETAVPVDEDRPPISSTAHADGPAIEGDDTHPFRAGMPAVPGYEILGELGRGGMGVVYRARQIRLDRVCALKMILAGAHADAQATARFLSEAQAIARLHHPHIVQIYSIGEARGLPYVELEYLPGGSLDRDLDGTPWNPARAARMVEQLARGIAEAHLAGIVHRDLKPGNVLLSVDGTPRITDFGLAKMLGSDSGLTKSEAILGSPSYMAPEQAEGRTKDVGPAADVYALGAILYELLTGRPPFRGATVLETLEQVKSAEPVPPSQLVPRLPRDVETIALKCLHKDPARRYVGAEALAEDLRRFVAGEPIVARPIGGLERAGLWYRRNRTVARLMGAIVLVLSLGTAIATSLALWANRERQLGEDRLYLAEIIAAYQAWQEGRLSLVHQYLQAHEPKLPGDPDRRGFEWYYLKRLCQLELRDIGAHPGGVNCLAHSPDGRLLATGGRDYVVRLWDVATSREVRGFNRHQRPVQGVAFSPDGRMLVSASLDRTIILWDTGTGRALHILPGHADEVWGVAFSPDGRTVASASKDRTVKIWDVVTGRQIRTLLGHSAGIDAVTYNSDGRILATAARDNTVRLWDPATGRETHILQGHAAPVTCVVFSRSGLVLASGSEDRTVRFWDAAGREARPLLNHPGAVRAVSFSPDGLAIAAAGDDNIVRIWDSAGREKLLLRGHLGRVNGLSYSKDGRTLASASAEPYVKVWDAVTSQEFVSEAGSGGFLEAELVLVAFGPGGRTLVSASFTTASHGRAGRVRIRDLELGRTIWSSVLIDYRVDNYFHWFDSMAFSPEGRRLVLRRRFGPPPWPILARFDVADGRRIRAGSEADVSTRGLAFTPSFRATPTEGNRGLVVQDQATFREILTLRGRSIFPHAAATSPHRRFAGADAGLVTVWDTVTGQEVLKLRGDARNIGGLAFNNDGLTLAAVNHDGSTTLWDATPLTREIAHARDARSVLAFCLAGSPSAAEVEASIRRDPTIIEDVRQRALTLANSYRRDQQIREAERVDDQAERMVRVLFVEGKSRQETLTHLRNDRSMGEAVRRRAIDLVDSTDDAMWEVVRPDPSNAASMNEYAWSVVRTPGRELWEYEIPLRRVEMVCRNRPSDSRSLSIRGVALYRLGEYPQAADTLQRSGPGNADADGAWRPVDLAFLAMAQRRLGQDRPARETMSRLRETMKAPRWKADQDAQAAFREADALEHDRTAPDKSSSR